jgi:hypothetical protein
MGPHRRRRQAAMTTASPSRAAPAALAASPLAGQGGPPCEIIRVAGPPAGLRGPSSRADAELYF